MKTFQVELLPDEFLRVLRGRLEMTQTQLAQRLGVSRQMVNYYEQGLFEIPETRMQAVQQMAEKDR